MANFCGECGDRLANATRFCGNCGAAVVDSSAGSTTQEDLKGDERSESYERNAASALNSPESPTTLFSSGNLTSNIPPSPARLNKRIAALFFAGLLVAVCVLVAYGVRQSRAQLEHQRQLREEQASLMQRSSEITKDNFHTLCSPLANCAGKFIVWTGAVRDDAQKGDSSFKVDSLNGYATVSTMFPLDEDLHSGDQVTFHGFVQQLFERGGDDDIITKGYVRSVIPAQQVEANREKEEQEGASAPDSPKVLNNAEQLDKKYGIEAALRCAEGADDYLRSVAKYDFKWDQTGMLETKFDQHLTNVVAPGIQTEISNKVALQNGFGAFQHVELFCNYDTQNKKVLGYQIQTNDQ